MWPGRAGGGRAGPAMGVSCSDISYICLPLCCRVLCPHAIQGEGNLDKLYCYIRLFVQYCKNIIFLNFIFDARLVIANLALNTIQFYVLYS
jgi:hypothetical protein